MTPGGINCACIVLFAPVVRFVLPGLVVIRSFLNVCYKCHLRVARIGVRTLLPSV